MRPQWAQQMSNIIRPSGQLITLMFPISEPSHLPSPDIDSPRTQRRPTLLRQTRRLRRAARTTWFRLRLQRGEPLMHPPTDRRRCPTASTTRGRERKSSRCGRRNKKVQESSFGSISPDFKGNDRRVIHLPRKSSVVL